MAKLSKPAIRRLTILVFVMAAISLTLFSCSTYCAQSGKTYLDMSDVHLKQLEEPENDAPAAVIHTSLGDITAVLYPEEAPVYTEQFMRLAKEGYYDGTYIFQVQSGVYFSAGSKDNTGAMDAVQSASPEEKVDAEKSANLWPFRGAFCVPLTGHDRNFWNNLFGKAADYCGTRFLVCDTIEFDDTVKADLENVDESAKEVTEAFLERGGVPNYSQQMTIFAQAYGDESFETIDKITEVKTAAADPETGYTKPLEDILIENIEITTWGEAASQ
ncbi:MAG: peptidylprolyl isomerase [Ruminococcus sp.]